MIGGPYEDLRIATPVSHLFERCGDMQRRIISRSDALELRDTSSTRVTDLPIIHHCEYNLAAEWESSERNHLQRIDERFSLDLVSFHLSSRYQNNQVVDGRFVGKGEPYSREDLLANVETNVRLVNTIFGESLLLVENNNHLSTDAYDVVTDPEFLTKVVETNNIGFLLDIGHAQISSVNSDMSFEKYVAGLPLEQCRQVHLSRPRIEDGVAVDAHDFLRTDDWRIFDSLLGELPHLEYVTIEYYKSAPVLLDQLQILDQGTSDVVVGAEQWDTEFFGVEVGSLKVQDLDVEVLNYALVVCRDRGIQCLYYTCDYEDRESRALAAEFDFTLVDTKLTLIHDLNEIPNDIDMEFSISEAQPSDIPSLRRIASTVYSQTRFYKDDHFSEDLCDKLYATWIENACTGYADAVFVAKQDGRTVGYITCNMDDGKGRIGLVGVDCDAQGEGVGTTLVNEALRWFISKGAPHAAVSTQEDNDAAKIFYEGCGFKLDSREVIFHRWFDGCRC